MSARRPQRKTQERPWPPPPRPRTRVLAAFALLSIAVLAALIGGTWAVMVLGPGTGVSTTRRGSGPDLDSEEASARSSSDNKSGKALEQVPEAFVSLSGEGRIAVVGLDGHLRTMDPAGGDVRDLTGAGAAFQFPAWSPDGSRIAAIGGSRTAGVGVFAFDDVVGDMRTRSRDALFMDADATPIALGWSPDGRRISFLTETEERIALRIVASTGGGDQVVGFGQPFYWAWMPDARRILAHVGGADTGSRLVFVDPDEAGASTDGGMNLARPGFFQAPAISPDGRSVAFAARASGGRRRVIVERNLAAGDLDRTDRSAGESEVGDERSIGERDSGDEDTEDGENAVEDGPGEGRRAGADQPNWVADPSSRVTIPHEGQVSLVWSPVGDQVAFISPPFDLPVFYGPLQMHDVPSGRTRTLSDDIAVAFFWSPDGRGIAYLKPLTGGDLPSAVDEMEASYFQPRDDVTVLTVSRNLRVSELLQRPRGPRLELWWIEIATGERRRITTFRPPISFVTQFLPYFDQYADSHKLWSPAGDALVFPFVIPDEPPTVYSVPLEGEPRRLAEGVFGTWSPSAQSAP